MNKIRYFISGLFARYFSLLDDYPLLWFFFLPAIVLLAVFSVLNVAISFISNLFLQSEV